MILMAELPRDLEVRIAAEAARRSMNTYDLLRVVMNETGEDSAGQTTLAALPFFISSTPPNWEQTVRDWAVRHNA